MITQTKISNGANNTLTLNPLVLIKRSSIRRKQGYLRIFWLISFISIFALLTVYIIQVNELAKTGYLISAYEKKIEALSEENKNLEINLSKTNSLDYVETLAKNLNFEKVKEIHYIKVLESAVAAK